MSVPSQKLYQQIDMLEDLTREELLVRWVKCYGADPFKGIRRKTLIRGIAYKLQEKTFGVLNASTSRRLLKIAQSADQKYPIGKDDCINSAQRRTKLQPGSKLVREWNGRTYEVIVADTGYVLNGITHPSLSACAKAITGAHWSGPRFFGARS